MLVRVGGANGGRELSIDRYFLLVLAAHASSLLADGVAGRRAVGQRIGDLETSYHPSVLGHRVGSGWAMRFGGVCRARRGAEG